LNEIVEALDAKPGETIIDGTFGAGGYTRAILATGATVVGFDRDPTVQRFTEGLPADRFRLIQDRFSQMAEHFEPQSVDGVVLDIGVSSMQLDEAERGFSFMRDGPLDMRMSDTGRPPPTSSTIWTTPSWPASSMSMARSTPRAASPAS
jgi:16S rRNA (cytosine1402-N4)-methyltransferase